MNKRDKEKIKKLKQELRRLAKKYDEIQGEASRTLGNISDPPEPDDWMYAEELMGYTQELETIQGNIEDAEEKIYTIQYKYSKDKEE